MGSSDFADVTNWTMNVSANLKEFASSSTSGHVKQVKGQFSGTVEFDVLIENDDDILDRLVVGDTVTLLLNEDPTRQWSVPALVSEISTEVNISEGDPPTRSISAATNGAWTYANDVVSAG